MSSKPFVTFTPDFIATRFPGYFFNIKDNKLYSMKIDGILKQLKYHKPNRWNHIGQWPIKLEGGDTVYPTGGYYVSVKGFKKFYAIEKLKELKHEPSVIPVKEMVPA